MPTFTTEVTALVVGVAAVMFTVGAVVMGVPAARFAIKSIKSLMN